MAPTLNFTVTRQTPELIMPAKATPREFKPLSDLDDRESLHFHAVVIQFYRRDPSMEGVDPVRVIRHAIARALVYYYPFAGRLRKCGPHKLVVECTAEGVAFTGADANVSLEQFGHVLCPPFPNLEDLVCPVPASQGLLHSPLLHFQVTRLKCEGFIFTIRINHAICDVPGLVQFLLAVAELARGAGAPSISPVWQRHLLTAPSPPRASPQHTAELDTTLNPSKQAERSFLLAAGDISALRRSLPPHARGCTKFELVVACAWRCRTIALAPAPDEEIRLSIFVNMRKRVNPPLPEGYYGNATVWPAAATMAAELSDSPVDFAVGLVRNIKSDATEEHMRWVVDMDLTAGGGGNGVAADPRRYVVADHTHSGLREVDYGWGAAAYGGSATVGIETAPGLLSFVTSFEGGLAVTICLPPHAMEVFGKELRKIINVTESRLASNFIASAL